MARLYSARPNAVRPRFERPRAAWRALGCGAGVAATSAPASAARSPSAHSRPSAPVFNFTTWVSALAARARGSSRWRRLRRRRPRRRSPCWSRRRRRRGRRSLRPGARRWPPPCGWDCSPARRADPTAGSVVTSRCAGRHLRRRAMIASDGSGWSGPISTRSTKQQPLGLRSSSTWSTFQGTAIVVWSGVVGELPFAVEVDVDVLGRRPEREGARGASAAAARAVVGARENGRGWTAPTGARCAGGAPSPARPARGGRAARAPARRHGGRRARRAARLGCGWGIPGDAPGRPPPRGAGDGASRRGRPAQPRRPSQTPQRRGHGRVVGVEGQDAVPQLHRLGAPSGAELRLRRLGQRRRQPLGERLVVGARDPRSRRAARRARRSVPASVEVGGQVVAERRRRRGSDRRGGAPARG